MDANKRIKQLEEALIIVLDQSWNGPLDADHPARDQALKTLYSKDEISFTLSGYAEHLARVAHSGQYRRDGKTPYIAHPIAVSDSLREEGEEVMAAALLHDVLEDTNLRLWDFGLLGLPKRVVQAVEVLTKRENELYKDYLTRVKSNEIATIVKIADINHNLSDQPTEKQKKKYAEALEFLRN